jgi:adenylate cyclase
MSSPDVEELEALGLYDPRAPDAEERLGLIQLSLDHGATYDDIRAAIEEKRLHAVPAELLIAPGTERLTLDAVITRAQVEPGFARRVWRALGFVEPGPDAAVCSEADVDLLRFYQLASDAFGPEPALSLARTAGASMARLADGAISSARSVLEAPLRSGGGSSLDIARTFVAVAEQVIPPVYPMLETVHRRHLVDSARRYAAWGVAPTAQHTSDAVVGFADLVGYTSLTQRLSPDQIERLVVGFEDRALAAVSLPGARLVKTIGDEAMFVAGNAEDALDIACALVADPELPSLRVGLASGEIVTRDGDLYGPVVNLAARLVATAEPDQIVFDAETLRRLPDGRARATSVGTRTLQGFDEPVEVFELEC